MLLSPAQAMAQMLSAEDLMNMPLEKLVNVEVKVTGASKYAEKSSESPSLIEVITAEDIRTYGYKTLAEALSGLHGVYPSNDRNYTTIGVRGFLITGTSNSRTLVMIDGRRMNENVYDSAYLGQEFLLDMALVDHIEFISGPGSSIYGANAMMGVINVVTKKGSDINGTQVEAGIGSFETATGRTSYGKTLANGTDVLLSVSGFYSDGLNNIRYPEYSFSNNGIAHDLDMENAQRLFGKIQSGNFTYEGGYVKRYKEVSTAAYSTIFNDPGYHTVDTNAYGELKYNRALNDKTQMNLKAFYHSYDSVGDYPYDFFGVYHEVDEYHGNWAGAEATFVTTAFDRHTVVVGGEFQFDLTQKLLALDPFGVYQNSNRSGFRSGLYAQDSIRLRDNLILSAGLRLDQHHMINRVQINPRLGLIWSPQSSTTIKLLYGSAYRAPNIFERDYDAFTFWAANPFNKEEHIKNYEAVAEWKNPTGLTLSGSLFYNEFTDMITRDNNFFSPTFRQYINSGNLRNLGIEIGGEKKWDNGREIKLSFNHNEYLAFDGVFWGRVDSPKNVAKLRYAEPLFDGRAKIGIENLYVGNRVSLYFHDEAGYDLVNMAVTSKELIPGAEFSISANNLFDSRQNMIGSPLVFQDIIPMNGRNLMVTLSKTF